LKEIWQEPPVVEDEPVTPPSDKAGRRPRLWREVLETLLCALVAFAVVRTLVQNFRIEGCSMEPNLHEQQFLLINKMACRLGQVQRGAIVVFHYPHNPKRDLIKRVVGLPGDHLEIVSGQVLIDGHVLDEPYILERAHYSHPATVIEPGHVFVLGDNRNNSSDSHTWGSLPMQNIIGKAVLCYWPPRYWGFVRHGQPADNPVPTH